MVPFRLACVFVVGVSGAVVAGMPSSNLFLSPRPARVRQGIDQPALLWDLGHYDPEAFPQYTLAQGLKVGNSGHVQSITRAYQDPTLQNVRLGLYANFLVSAYCHDAFALQHIRSWPAQLLAIPTIDASDATAAPTSSRANDNHLWHAVFYLDAQDHCIAAELSEVEFQAMGFHYSSIDALTLMRGSPLAQSVRHRLDLGPEAYWDLYRADSGASAFRVSDTMPQ